MGVNPTWCWAFLFPILSEVCPQSGPSRRCNTTDFPIKYAYPCILRCSKLYTLGLSNKTDFNATKSWSGLLPWLKSIRGFSKLASSWVTVWSFRTTSPLKLISSGWRPTSRRLRPQPPGLRQGASFASPAAGRQLHLHEGPVQPGRVPLAPLDGRIRQRVERPVSRRSGSPAAKRSRRRRGQRRIERWIEFRFGSFKNKNIFSSSFFLNGPFSASFGFYFFLFLGTLLDYNW